MGYAKITSKERALVGTPFWLPPSVPHPSPTNPSLRTLFPSPPPSILPLFLSFPKSSLPPFRLFLSLLLLLLFLSSSRLPANLVFISVIFCNLDFPHKSHLPSPSPSLLYLVHLSSPSSVSLILYYTPQPPVPIHSFSLPPSHTLPRCLTLPSSASLRGIFYPATSFLPTTCVCVSHEIKRGAESSPLYTFPRELKGS